MGYEAALPNTCRPTFARLSEYRVAMDAPSRAENRGGETTRFPATRVRPDVRETRSSRVRQTQVQRELSRTKLVATCLMSIARLKLDSTHGWVNCAREQSFGASHHHPTIV